MQATLKVTRFADHYYLFARLDDDAPFSLSLMRVGNCPDCGQAYVAVQWCEDAPDLLIALSKAKREIAGHIGRAGEEISFYVCESEQAPCWRCGMPITLPVPELLDADRTAFGRYAMWKGQSKVDR